jgi:hypothetical protein
MKSFDCALYALTDKTGKEIRGQPRSHAGETSLTHELNRGVPVIHLLGFTVNGLHP